MTKSKINKKIKVTGLTICGERGDGYFYFLDANEEQVGESVYVAYLNQLTLPQWVEEAHNRSGIVD